MEKKHLYKMKDEGYKAKAFDFCEAYKEFLTQGKTERLCVDYCVKIAKEKGFINIFEKSNFMAGDKIYYINKNRSAVFAVLGSEDIENGINLVAAHIDSPRLDLKPVPVAEDGSLAYFRTHYYGGIKKYQWVAMPLSMYGVVYKKDGTKIDISIGDNEQDTVFCVTDLLPHLATKQMGQKISEVITGEKLMVLAGSDPNTTADEKDDKEAITVRANLLKILKEQYNIEEDDFYSAEIEIVPTGMARDVGFDRSMVGGYGQDDRVCSYTGFKAILEVENPNKTAVLLLADKEEVGSMGNSGMQSKFLEFFLEELKPSIRLNKAMNNTKCLSADVAAAFDPQYGEVYEKQNTPIFGSGLTMLKYTGSRGKGGSSEASAEFVSELRSLFDENKITFQFAELGKVDEGGGGTVAQYIANLGADVIDAGVALLSMHSPFEIAHKADIYEAYRAYLAFFKN
jgi:aspartyl aminopeptidase